MNTFKKVDKFIFTFFSKNRLKELNEQRDFLIAIKDRKLTIDSAINILDRLIADENGTCPITCNLLA